MEWYSKLVQLRKRGLSWRDCSAKLNIPHMTLQRHFPKAEQFEKDRLKELKRLHSKVSRWRRVNEPTQYTEDEIMNQLMDIERQRQLAESAPVEYAEASYEPIIPNTSPRPSWGRWIELEDGIRQWDRSAPPQNNLRMPKSDDGPGLEYTGEHCAKCRLEKSTYWSTTWERIKSNVR